MAINNESRSDRTKRLMFGCFWVGTAIAWWMGSVIPVIYVVANAP